jgi:hypothetical protein
MGSRLRLAIAREGSVGRKPTVWWWIALLLVSGGLALATAAGTAHANLLGNKACALLIASKTPGVPQNASDEEILNACTRGKCLTHYTDSDGQTRCAYSLGAFLKLQCASTARKARAFVHNQLRKGYRRVNVGADIAGIVSSSKEAAVVVAVHRAIVLFTEGASSDDNPPPGVRRRQASRDHGRPELHPWPTPGNPTHLLRVCYAGHVGRATGVAEALIVD